MCSPAQVKSPSITVYPPDCRRGSEGELPTIKDHERTIQIEEIQIDTKNVPASGTTQAVQDSNVANVILFTISVK